MFKECFFEPEANIGRKALVLPMSVAIHAAILTALIVAPMIRSGALPEIPDYVELTIAPPPRPSPPPSRQGPHRTVRHNIKPVLAPRVSSGKRFIAPVDIPLGIADEALPDLPLGDGIEGANWDIGFDNPNAPNDGRVFDVIEKIVGETVAPVPVAGEIKRPKLLRQVPPVYPEIARLARVEGDVEIEAQTDVYGRVVRLKVKRSIPLLDQAAVDAVKQWVYEPMVINGKPRGVIFNVTVNFELKSS
jgi:protein TonB